MIAIALYKGTPNNDLWHIVSHYLICLRTLSKYSHAELLIDDMCYSSSARDGGVRAKKIDLTSGKWDVIQVSIPIEQELDAIEWFGINYGKKYDWMNILRYMIPFVHQKNNQYVCFEAIGTALGFAGAYKLNANDLLEWALERATDSKYKGTNE